MPIFELGNSHDFPNPALASDEGVLAVGGDLHPERVLNAYQSGVFPWPHEGYPLLWFSPDPRFVVKPSEVKIGRTLRKRIRKNTYTIRLDHAFKAVMQACAKSKRLDQDGTWITPEMVEAYSSLFAEGFAHSVEAYDKNLELVGGLYGISLGGIFFGESMFSKKTDASKVAFAALAEQLKKWDFDLIDCQAPTEHLASFGAKEMPRRSFLRLLKKSLKKPTRLGKWSFET